MVLGMHTFPAGPTVRTRSGRRLPGVARRARSNRAGVDSQTLSFIHEMQVWLSQVLLGGLLDRYPNLKMAVFESNAQWLPYMLETLRPSVQALRATSVSVEGGPAAVGSVPRAVRDLASSPTRSGDVPPVGAVREDRHLGVGRVPPRRRRLVERDAQHDASAASPRTVQAELLGGNARRFYGIEGKIFVTEEPRPDRPARLVPPGSRARALGGHRRPPARAPGEDREGGCGHRPADEIAINERFGAAY